MHRTTRTLEPGTGPWFWVRPMLAVVVSAVLFAGIVVLSWTVGGVEDSVSMLYVLPISLLALGFGFRAGLAAGVFAVVLLMLWVVFSGESLSALGWLSHATPLLLLGPLVGAATDRIRASATTERRAAAVTLLQREAAEINDHVLQQMAAAKWLLEAGHHDEGIDLLESTMDTAQQLVSRMLGSASVLPGDLRRSQPVGDAPKPVRSGG